MHNTSIGLEVTNTTAAMSPCPGSHLLQRDLVGDEGFCDVKFQSFEDQRTRIGRRSTRGVEVDLFAPEVVQGFDFRTDEDVQFGGKQAEDIGDPLADVRNQRLNWSRASELIIAASTPFR